MRMPGQALHHLVIVRRRLQAGTRGELSDRAAIDLLPGRLVLQRGRRVGLRRAAISVSLSSRSTRLLLRSMRTRSPVSMRARPEPAADSGEALRIEGLPEVPLWRPSPMVGHSMRSEEHTSELQSLMRISYAVFCLKKKKTISTTQRIYMKKY